MLVEFIPQNKCTSKRKVSRVMLSFERSSKHEGISWRHNAFLSGINDSFCKVLNTVWSTLLTLRVYMPLVTDRTAGDSPLSQLQLNKSSLVNFCKTWLFPNEISFHKLSGDAFRIKLLTNVILSISPNENTDAVK
jgi:hypothetical protein